MKNLILILLFSVFGQTGFSQVKEDSDPIALDDFGRISFFTDVVVSDPDFDGRAVDKVKGGLERMLLKESLGKSADDRFGLIAVPIIYSKEKTSTTPPKYFYEFGIDIIAVDYKEKTKYGVYTFDQLSGMNANSQRALMSGLKQFKSSRAFSEFIGEIKTKIIDYYTANCDFILTDAETNASNDNFDGALSILASVPTVCEECYNKSQEKSRVIYVQKLERECQAIVSEANSLISAESWKEAASVLKKVLPGISCHAEAVGLMEKIETHWCGVNLGKAKGYQQSKNFEEAAKHLAMVPTTSPCGADADALGKKIYGELSAIEKRDWEFKMKEYDDGMAREQRDFDFSVNKFERGANRDDRALELDFEATKVIQQSLVEVAKAAANTSINIKKDYSFLGF